VHNVSVAVEDVLGGGFQYSDPGFLFLHIHA
jgi:hypothetical protein